jgi:hypothetical protein
MSKAQVVVPPKADIDDIMQVLYSDQCRDNPLFFVLYAFPWGVPGTTLAHVKGPREWQRRELEKIAEHIAENKKRVARGEMPLVYKLAVASGRGIGKSALVSWLTLWMMSCHYGSTTIISANTDTQITDKTFGEIGRWLTLSINHFFFEVTQKSITAAPWLKERLKADMKIDAKYYYANGVLWNEDNPEAFAGAHNPIGMMVIFDESSGIPQNIWNVAIGFFTEISCYRFWFAFSNPRSGVGAFYDCFYNGHTWNTRQINSLHVEGVDTTELLELIRKNGEDSDEAKVEVYGQFPRQGTRQFIARDVVKMAKERILEAYDNTEPLIMGVDPARFGDDATVFYFRRGRDGKSIPFQEYKGKDNMQVVDLVLQAIHNYSPDHIVVDSGAGAGIIDRLKQLGIKVHEALFGSSSNDPQYYDHRTELWGLMLDWLRGAMIPSDPLLEADLCNPEKETQGREDKIKLESKEKMKRRGIKSPNVADALALTFHKKWVKVNRQKSGTGPKNKHKSWTKPLL